MLTVNKIIIIKLLLLIVTIFALWGCTQTNKNYDYKIVQYKNTYCSTTVSLLGTYKTSHNTQTKTSPYELFIYFEMEKPIVTAIEVNKITMTDISTNSVVYTSTRIYNLKPEKVSNALFNTSVSVTDLNINYNDIKVVIDFVVSTGTEKKTEKIAFIMHKDYKESKSISLINRMLSI
jgi:hypothetical protein